MSRWCKNPLYQSQDDIIIDNIPLPKGWKELTTKDGRKYYGCVDTKHTQWLHPAIPIGTLMSNGLPYGWEKKIDPKTNKEYFVCHVGRFNTWSPPVGRKKEFYQ